MTWTYVQLEGNPDVDTDGITWLVSWLKGSDTGVSEAVFEGGHWRDHGGDRMVNDGYHVYAYMRMPKVARLPGTQYAPKGTRWEEPD